MSARSYGAVPPIWRQPAPHSRTRRVRWLATRSESCHANLLNLYHRLCLFGLRWCHRQRTLFYFCRSRCFRLALVQHGGVGVAACDQNRAKNPARFIGRNDRAPADRPKRRSDRPAVAGCSGWPLSWRSRSCGDIPLLAPAIRQSSTRQADACPVLGLDAPFLRPRLRVRPLRRPAVSAPARAQAGQARPWRPGLAPVPDMADPRR